MTLSKPAQSARGLTFWGQWALGNMLVLGLLGLLAYLKTGEVAPHYRTLGVLALLGSIPVYTLLGVYNRHTGYLTGAARLLAGWLLLLSVLAVLAFITKTSELYSREVLLQWTLIGYGVQLLAFIPLHSLSCRYHNQLREACRAAILGTGDLALQLADKISRKRNEPLLGLIRTDDLPSLDDALYPELGASSYLRELIEQHDIRRLYIALPAHEMEQVKDLYIDLLDAGVDVVWIPDLASLVMLNHSVTDIEGLPAIHLNESPLTSYPTSAVLKAVLDRVAAALGIIVISPVLIGTAIAVKLSSPGPVLFRQPRHGMNGEVFQVLKFRSMKVHDDQMVKQAKRNDSRITAVGQFIRKTSIDELPQLFNVLKGDMSLVGPRPHAVAHNDYYSDKITAYMARHRIKPGITGLAQVSGCRGETETLDKMQKRVELDLQYINNWSVWLDIKILIKTPFTLISKDIY
ncbi:putative colanic acid biosynthesis UDP-glucose lipid carrier transferase [Marinobacterium halophilum]|uniref:Putative colanic acid biosynthesis UDP-glucose lipid carrier transferase n=1 Tax=Marinobacterium halophilum TaxID=267374 RepID=A0A2P8F257_9GAMM|nr:undecaprenyl-phosphate glucose phosphotransferase [Marinobacterium halophilum]PSL15800.1 putative colanic acid biosynthesis UDP-glucose lipid carrier transferase [Marinobacterium halophilum]